MTSGWECDLQDITLSETLKVHEILDSSLPQSSSDSEHDGEKTSPHVPALLRKDGPPVQNLSSNYSRQADRERNPTEEANELDVELVGDKEESLLILNLQPILERLQIHSNAQPTTLKKGLEELEVFKCNHSAEFSMIFRESILKVLRNVIASRIRLTSWGTVEISNFENAAEESNLILSFSNLYGNLKSEARPNDSFRDDPLTLILAHSLCAILAKLLEKELETPLEYFSMCSRIMQEHFQLLELLFTPAACHDLSIGVIDNTISELSSNINHKLILWTDCMSRGKNDTKQQHTNSEGTRETTFEQLDTAKTIFSTYASAVFTFEEHLFPHLDLQVRPIQCLTRSGELKQWWIESQRDTLQLLCSSVAKDLCPVFYVSRNHNLIGYFFDGTDASVLDNATAITSCINYSLFYATQSVNQFEGAVAYFSEQELELVWASTFDTVLRPLFAIGENVLEGAERFVDQLEQGGKLYEKLNAYVAKNIRPTKSKEHEIMETKSSMMPRKVHSQTESSRQQTRTKSSQVVNELIDRSHSALHTASASLSAATSLFKKSAGLALVERREEPETNINAVSSVYKNDETREMQDKVKQFERTFVPDHIEFWVALLVDLLNATNAAISQIQGVQDRAPFSLLSEASQVCEETSIRLEKLLFLAETRLTRLITFAPVAYTLRPLHCVVSMLDVTCEPHGSRVQVQTCDLSSRLCTKLDQSIAYALVERRHANFDDYGTCLQNLSSDFTRLPRCGLVHYLLTKKNQVPMKKHENFIAENYFITHLLMANPDIDAEEVRRFIKNVSEQHVPP